MNITPETKITDIINAYPGLLDQLIELEPKFSMLKSPIGKIAIRGKTMQDAADRYHVPMDQLMSMLQEQIDKLQQS